MSLSQTKKPNPIRLLSLRELVSTMMLKARFIGLMKEYNRRMKLIKKDNERLYRESWYSARAIWAQNLGYCLDREAPESVVFVEVLGDIVPPTPSSRFKPHARCSSAVGYSVNNFLTCGAIGR